MNRGFLAAESVVHYDLHEKVDVKHSADFFAVLRPYFARSAEDRYYIEQGLRLGAYLFNRLYEDLHRARARRAFCGGHGRTGLHTRA